MNLRPEPMLPPRWWKWGMPPPELWIRNIDRIEAIIKRYKIPPVSQEHLYEVGREVMTMDMPAAGVKSAKLPPFKRPPFPGGMRIPHFHFKGEVYLVNEAQWKEFATPLLEDFRKKLAAVNEIGFEQLMELNEAMNIIR